MDRCARFSRFILFDRRGTGLSDRPREPATLEARMEEHGAFGAGRVEDGAEARRRHPGIVRSPGAAGEGVVEHEPERPLRSPAPASSSRNAMSPSSKGFPARGSSTRPGRTRTSDASYRAGEPTRISLPSGSNIVNIRIPKFVNVSGVNRTDASALDFQSA